MADLLFSGEAETVEEAEEIYLERNLGEVIRLARSGLSDEDFRRHPLIALLLARGSRSWEDRLD